MRQDGMGKGGESQSNRITKKAKDKERKTTFLPCPTPQKPFLTVYTTPYSCYFYAMKAAIIFGSQSDAPVMKKAAAVFREFGVSCTAHVVSAHRAPELLGETVRRLEAAGVEVIVAGAGLAAHLPGVIASQTLIPVIGVPIASGSLGGLDALLSIVQMPKPVPVAAVGVENAANAAVAEAIQAGWRKTHFAPCRLVMDSELAADEMRGSNLVLIGNARTNAVWRELDKGIGMNITGDGITWGGRSWFGDDVAIQAVVRHPKNSARRVVVIGGHKAVPESFGTLNLSRDGWFRHAVWGGGEDGPELRDAGN